MRRFEQSNTPYEDAAKAVLGLGLHILADAAPDLELPQDATVATEPSPLRRRSLIDWITALQTPPA